MLNLRASKRGMVDLIVMILMIVLLLGVSVLAFIAFDRAKKEEIYVAKMRDLPAAQHAEIDATRARFAQVSNLIGFKGNADFSSPAAIKLMLEKGGSRNGALQRLNSQNPDDMNSSGIKNVTFDEKGKKMPRVIGTKEEPPVIYTWADGITVVEAIAAQDFLINSLVEEYVPSMQKQVEMQRKWRNEANDARAAAVDKGFGDLATDIEGENAALRTTHEGAIVAESTMTEASKKEMESYDNLSGQAVMDAYKAKNDAMRATMPAREAAREMGDEFQKKASRRIVDDTRDPDGYVFLVDNVSGWVWINIGQKSDVRLDMSFQVLRADPSLPSLMPIGEIRVKEILRGNVARCRIDALDDQGVMPRQGDIVRNPNFNDRQYYSYCLVGKFGGNSTRYTYQQWVTKLTEMGFHVVQTITGSTDVAILGEDWRSDKVYLKSKEEGLEFETMTEKDLMWFLGLEGPEAK
jgi:hypothetical protein